MKKLFSIFLCTLLLTTPVLAKSGSGGQPSSEPDPIVSTPEPEAAPSPEPAEVSEPEPEPEPEPDIVPTSVPTPAPVSTPSVVSDPTPVVPATTSVPVPAKEESVVSVPATTPEETLQKTPKATIDTEKSAESKAVVTKEEEKVVEPEQTYSDCAEKGRSNVRSGVTCFMSLPNFYSQDTFSDFSEDFAKTGKVSDGYQPLGCAYTNQNTTCRDIYWKLYQAGTYDEAFGKPVIDSAKKVLELPTEILPTSKVCASAEQGCMDEYEKKVKWLVGARLYLAQQQARKWYDAGQLPEVTFKEFLIFIVEAKHRFYPSTSQTEQKNILQETIMQWKKLAQVAKENELNPLEKSY
ncbi:MAG: hypothetical protein P1V18_00855 [Candidatus Gracilibacteria bacterium]|nr:hypothetical protein [Candidatus Gracilibacteria bacterium]